jgi:hypothetical protein
MGQFRRACMSATTNEIATSQSLIDCPTGGGLSSPQPAPLMERAELSQALTRWTKKHSAAIGEQHLKMLADSSVKRAGLPLVRKPR